MNKYRKLIPIAAVILIALGVNLDRFGIDLQQLAGGLDQATQSGQANRNNTSSNGGNAASNSSASSAGLVLATSKHWSDTRPQINLKHVFLGEINRQGKPVGYHSRPGGNDPGSARVTRVKAGPNRAGIYTADIEIRDGNQWKSKFSSFFPDNMSEQAVIDSVLHAFRNSENPKKQPWSGPSGHGFTIQGYTSSRGGINTAFPVYSAAQ